MDAIKKIEQYLNSIDLSNLSEETIQQIMKWGNNELL